jgi:erythromycin esterase
MKSKNRFLPLVPAAVFFMTVLFLSAECIGTHRKVENRMERELLRVSTVLPDRDPADWDRSLFRECGIPGDATVVAVGEAAHGSSTLFSFKDAMVRYLVEDEGFRLLCYEFSFEQSLEIDSYINGASIDIDSLLGRQSWIQANTNVLSLLHWLRNFNDTLPRSERVHFIGVDCQTDMFYPDRLGYHISRLCPELENELKGLLNTLESCGKPLYKGMADDDYDFVASLIESLKSKTDAYFDRMPEGAGEPRTEDLIMQLLNCMEISHRFLFSAYNGGKNMRDSFMRDNLLWARNTFSGNDKTIFWSHNAHARVDPDYYGEGGPSAGMLLRQSLGDDYLVIGTAFGGGAVTAVEEDPATGADTPPHTVTIDTLPVPGSLNKLMGKSEEKAFVADLRRVRPRSSLSDYLENGMLFFGVGDFFTGRYIDHFRFYEGPIAGEFDLIFWFDTVLPLTLLQSHSSVD